MITFLIAIIVIIAVAVILIMLLDWLASVAPLPGPLYQIIKIVIVLCAILAVLYHGMPLIGGGRYL